MVQRLAQSALTLILFFVLLFGYTKLAGPIPFSVNSISTTKSSTFDVTGTGKAQVKPDKASVNVGVQATGSTAQDVQNQMNSLINKISASIKALGIDAKDIQTSNYNVSPTYDYTKSNQAITGYTADTNLTVTVTKIDLANQVLDTAVANGATQAGGVSFDVVDGSAAEDQARQLAVTDAKKKAAQVAKMAGFELGRIVNYSETPNGQPGPMPYAMSAAKVESAPTQLEAGSNEVNISVTLSYEVK